MFNPEHLDKFCEGPKAWNAWRQANPTIVPELSDIRLTLHQRQLGPSTGGPIDLHAANLQLASLLHATLTGADLRDARLISADLSYARLDHAKLDGANLTDAILDQADLMGAVLDDTVLFGTDLSTARNLTAAQLELAYGDATTRLPSDITPPRSWFPAADDDDDDDYSGWGIEAPLEENLYEILGLTPGASSEEIRTAYRNLVKKLHPDINPNDEQAQERFKRVSAAYRILNDPDQRERYDRGEIDDEGRVCAEFEARQRYRRTVVRYFGAAVGSFLLAAGALGGVWWIVLSTQSGDKAVKVAASQPKTSERLGGTTAPATDEPRTTASSQSYRQAEPESRLAALPEDAPQHEAPRPTAPDVAAPAPSPDSRPATRPEDAAQQARPMQVPKPATPDVAELEPSRDSGLSESAARQVPPVETPRPAAPDVAAPAPSPDGRTAPLSEDAARQLLPVETPRSATPDIAAPEPSRDSGLAALPEDAAPQVPPVETPRPIVPDIAAPAPNGDSRLAALSEDAAQRVPPVETNGPSAPDIAGPGPSDDRRQEQDTEAGTEQLPAPKPVAAAAPPSSTPPELGSVADNGTAAPPTAANEVAPDSPSAEDTPRLLHERYENTVRPTVPSARDRENVAAIPQDGQERKASPGSYSYPIGAAKQWLKRSWQEPTARDLVSQALRDRAIRQTLSKKNRPAVASYSDGTPQRRTGLSQEPPTNALPRQPKPARSASLKRAAPAQQRKSEPAANMAARPQAPSASIAADDAAQRQARQQQAVSDILVGGF